MRSLFQITSFRLAVEDALSVPVDLVTSESSDKEFLKAIWKDEVLPGTSGFSICQFTATLPAR